MKLRSLRIEKSPELMIIPMIDIIFFLLVFFMLSSLSMIEQRTMAVSLPQAAQANAENIKSLDVTVLKDGGLSVGGSTVNLNELTTNVAAQVAADQNVRVVLRGDRDVDYGRVVQVLDEIKAAGAKNISIATQRKK